MSLDATGFPWSRFCASLPASVSSTPAGAIAFYMHHRVIDMLGLNDYHIARTEPGNIGFPRAGHMKGDGAYVLSRKPDYILMGNVAVLEFPLDEEKMATKLIRKSEHELWANPEFHRDYELRSVRLHDEGPFQYFSFYQRRAEAAKEDEDSERREHGAEPEAEDRLPNGFADRAGEVRDAVLHVQPHVRGQALLHVPEPAEHLVSHGDRVAVGAGEPFEIEVTVHNVGAGHNLPTSLVEYRRVWVDLVVRDDDGNEIFRSAWDNEVSDVPEGGMRFVALAGDADGNPTYKPWEVTHFLWKRMVPAKGTATDVFRVPATPQTGGALSVEARLYYTIAPRFVAKAIMGDRYVDLDPIEIASAKGTVSVRLPRN